ncbi:MAG: DUF1080 domain-containing protein [Kiritimatiellae bacterium]|nr:DUF1080 domain-containing protein [Kiritimatiellia bacterium]
MKLTTSVAACTCLLLPVFTPTIAPADGDGWRPLFAADLSDADAPPGVWRWEDGALTASEDRCLWTREEFENFELELEFRLSPGANSGVILYCTDPANWILKSVEVQLLDDTAPQHATVPPTMRCAAIFGHLGPKEPTGCGPDRWHRLRIVARGPMISVAVNDRTVTEMDMRQWTSPDRNPDGSEIPPWLRRPLASLATRGRIGLQGRHAGAPVWFRNLRVRPARN